MQQYPIWNIKHAGPYASVSEVFLANRGLTADDLGNSPDLLNDPFLMADMDRAADRIERAIRDGERIIVYGDYDVDGVTSTAVLMDFLDHVGANASPILPDRYADGYGMRAAGAERAIKMGAQLIVTSDNGISSFEAIDMANAAGVDVVVIDHHHPQDRMPAAAAVVNPNRPDCAYPFKGLAAVGVAFKVVQALSSRFIAEEERRRYLNSLLDLVALGTVADMMPMMGENRLLTRRGLQVLSETKRPGVRALKGLAGSRGRTVDETTVGYFLGPRINSAGRLASPHLALSLLRARTAAEATKLAEELDALNTRRQGLQNDGVDEAIRQVEEQGLTKNKVLMVHGPEWHLGVIGLIAGRLKERFFRPAIVTTAAKGGGIHVGSARSAGGYNIVEAIFRCSDLLTEYGGHADAAGFSVPSENHAALRERLVADGEARLQEEDLTPQLEVDARLDHAAISKETVAELAAFEPFGQRNEPPRFVTEGCRVARVDAVGQGAHLKLNLEAGSRTCDAIWWRKGDLVYELNRGARVDVAYGLGLNEWNGESRLQMVVEDMKLSEAPN